MSVRKLLIIGAGIGQIPLIRKAKARGIHVTAVTIPGDFPGIKEADECWYIDIYDKDSIVQKAKEHGIDAVISDQNDFTMPTVAYVAEKLGFPGNTCEQIYSYSNKSDFLAICEKTGVPAPQHISVSSSEIDYTKIPFSLPWIIKPSDAQSSMGVKKINSIDDVKDAVEYALHCSKTQNAVIEEFFLGKEIVCEGVISNGKYYNLSFADRLYFDRTDILIPKQTLFPSLINQSLLKKIVEYESRIARFVNPKFAIVHSEYLINEESKEIRVVESALRGGGVYISSDLIPLATGIDINEWILDQALNIQSDIESLIAKNTSNSAGYVCFYLPDGTITSIDGIEELRKLPYVHLVSLDNITIGKKTSPLINKGDRYGPILLSANNRKDLDERIKHVQRTLKIKTTNSDSKTFDIIWD